jgi:hypothetical protein
MFFFIFLLVDGRIRIRIHINKLRNLMPILEAKNIRDTDSDTENCMKMRKNIS